MKFRRNRKSKKARIEIIPMIDVMFFLLASFMLASIAMLDYQGINVNLAVGHGEKINHKEPLIINIDAQNQIFFTKKMLKISELSKVITEKITDPEQPIIIACDQNAKQGTAIAVMMEAQKSGIHHFSILIEPQK